MHPAFSVIVFTVLSGAGYGLAAVLGLGLLDPSALATKVAHILALTMISAGLLSSTLHLGNPQRAWRAFSQWRSSWLSREGVLSIITFVPLILSAANSLFLEEYNPTIGVIGALLCAATVYCTAMIYASLKTVDAWHTRRTPLCYLLFSATGGLVIGSLFGAAGGGSFPMLPILAALFLVLSWIAKFNWRQRALTAAPLSTPESATGLGGLGAVRLLERPHMTENYLTNEMGFKVARKHAGKLWRIAVTLGAVAPLLVLALTAIMAGAGSASAVLFATVAVLCHVAGMLVERWLFFAEARHAVVNYYGG